MMLVVKEIWGISLRQKAKWQIDIKTEGQSMSFVIGGTVVIEAETFEYTPFSTSVLSDPAYGCQITIYNPDNDIIVNNVDMTKSLTGKYYYKWQTTTSLPAGTYTIYTTANASFDGKKKKTIVLSN